MFYEIRTYRLKNGAIPTYLKVVEEEGIAIQRKHLGELVAYFFSEIGPINEIVHIWAYPSLDERERRRAALMNDAAWRDFLPKIRDLIEVAENKIMKAARFSSTGAGAY
ncbi:NIPSNAP family protein [Sinorhizobium meliloti]|uniref:NIPSNAP family protein n=1 Tax=Rhizobium meliloti TaxID=382 RepID=UPI000FDC2BFF|nr:NIPSNAP family protein [Sinorhizobium meliloti]RVG79045.1 NIPSNAP family protein [Sinorhizobium meliloti]RVI36113.1 NIPSNAP family protein [Sinorhizobium meliloti]RVI43636.1 NIPSNAP family protein [Sinorhizobium meliloti]RVJ22205.1 NIPSNAP family protein [Sinorhizobium meliloti]RVJ95899.1 NIPSNAP family protein [Sinorhizobium meliloti]